MSAELDYSKGFAAIAYRGETPWHGEGQTISSNDTIETMLAKAGLDYAINEEDIFFDYNGAMTKVDNRKALIRSDNGAFFSIMSERGYHVRQPKEIVEFFRDLCDFGGYEIETLGALFDGKKVWCLAKSKSHEGNIGDDLINPYILLADSYDGSLATTCQATSVRVVCNNTLSYSVNSKQGNKIKVKHSSKFDADRVKDQFALTDKAFDAYLKRLRAFQKVKMSPEFKERFFLKLFGGVTKEGEKANKHFFIGANEVEHPNDAQFWTTAKIDYDVLTTRSANVVDRLLSLSEPGNSPGSEFGKGTLYNALQTATYYIDHESAVQGKNASRWANASLGKGNDIKDFAYELADNFKL